MNHPIVEQAQQSIMLYDPQWAGQISAAWFQARYWQGAAEPTPAGRGRSYFIICGAQACVLRHYQRGGLVARLFTDQYLWTGLEQTRPWREWRLLTRMYEQGLPVPKPVAAHVQRQGFYYRGDILLERIVDALPLSRCLQDGALPPHQWQAIGRCIRWFHRQGIYHADLNAHNILLRDAEVFLIDFDKGEQRPAGRWCQGNLRRLQRSLTKLANQHPCFAFNVQDWQYLLTGYDAAEETTV
ncbi:MAG: 3-deoxy-D-manno-octulosonic acid kinase [Gammaproteobacteria bacterium]